MEIWSSFVIALVANPLDSCHMNAEGQNKATRIEAMGVPIRSPAAEETALFATLIIQKVPQVYG